MYGYELKINMRRLANLYDVTIPSPGRLTTRKKCRLQCKLKRPSKAEQKKIFTRYLQNGKAKNQSDLARIFNVSRAWISKVMNS